MNIDYQLYYDMKHRIRISGPDIEADEEWYAALHERVDGMLAGIKLTLELLYPDLTVEVN